MKDRLTLPFRQWPERHRADWERATAPSESLFDAGAAAARLRPASIESYRMAYGAWLGFLGRRGWLDPALPAAEAVTRDRLDAYVAERRARGNANATIKDSLAFLHAALRLMAPGADIDFIRRPGGLPLDRALPSGPKRVWRTQRRSAGATSPQPSPCCAPTTSPSRSRSTQRSGLSKRGPVESAMPWCG